MTTPSTVKALKDSFNEGQSERHDEIHLWLNDQNNRTKIVTYCYNQNRFYRDRKPPEGSEIIRQDSTYEAERPIYSGYQGSYLLGVIDALLSFHVDRTYRTEQDKEAFEKFGRHPSQTIASFYLLCEFKPELKKIGSILAQINIYRNALQAVGSAYRNNEKAYDPILPVIITFDERYPKYLEFFKSQGVDIFHIMQ